jgi:hypothetical protein
MAHNSSPCSLISAKAVVSRHIGTEGYEYRCTEYEYRCTEYEYRCTEYEYRCTEHGYDCPDERIFGRRSFSPDWPITAGCGSDSLRL